MMRVTTGRRGGWLLPLVLASALVFAGCDSDDDNNTASLPSVSTSWQEFQGGDWAAASQGFLEALDGNPEHPEALCGLAWSQGMITQTGGADYRQSIEENFLLADQLRPVYLDAWAGLANFYSAENQPLRAVEWSLDLLEEAGEGYTFTHRTTVNSRSMHGIAAWNLFKLARYEESVLHVRAVFPDFAPNPADPLYLETLLARIDDI